MLYSKIKIFGCLAFARDHTFPKDKFHAQSAFMGYPLGKRIGDCMILNTRNSLFPETWYLMNRYFLLCVQIPLYKFCLMPGKP